MRKFKPRSDEARIYGLNVCLKVFEKRPKDIVCAYLVEERLRECAGLAKFLAQNKRPYHVVTENELQDICESSHHQGICLFAKKIQPLPAAEFLKLNAQQKNCIVLALDQVGNPHNIGAIMRSAAHFAVNGLMMEKASGADSSAAVKASCGGRESLAVIESFSFKHDIELFRKNGFQIVTTSSHAKISHLNWSWPAKTLLILGEEGQGIHPDLFDVSQTVAILGSGAVESLNVSVAAALLCQEFRRKYPN
jgi:TrmH RNA methyltransferase